MTFKQVASETSPGRFSIRTDGLHERSQAEIEIVGLPESALEAAGKLIDYIVEAVVEQSNKELKANENVGMPLTIIGHEELGAVLIAVRAAPAEPPKGFFSRILGKGKGVLRLIDLVEPDGDTPWIAVATMMLYRANCRVATGDTAGALRELRDAIELVPAPRADKKMPATLDTSEAELNWQNHLVYLRLAELVDDEAERSAILRDTFTRFRWLALEELGATVDAWKKPEPDLVDFATHILRTNLAAPMEQAGPHPALRAVASPIWTPGEDGRSQRTVSLVPESFVAYCFGDHLADARVVLELARFGAAAIERYAGEPWRLADLTSDARSLYDSENAPTAALVGERRTSAMLLSATMADAARKLFAGATWDEIHASFGLLPDEDGALAASLREKLAPLEEVELHGYMSSMGADG